MLKFTLFVRLLNFIGKLTVSSDYNAIMGLFTFDETLNLSILFTVNR